MPNLVLDDLSDIAGWRSFKLSDTQLHYLQSNVEGRRQQVAEAQQHVFE